MTDPAAVDAAVRAIRPSRVVHAAGLTNVDLCEEDPAQADAVNAATALHLALSVGADVPIVYLSTDQVYDGTNAPHAEDKAAPINAYGRSKLGGEMALAARRGSLVLRVNFFGPSRTPGRTSLSDWVIGRLKGRERLPLFVDSLFSPLHMATLAGIVQDCLAAKIAGIFNVGSREGMSKRDFGLAIARRLGFATDLAVDCRSADVPGRAPRPLDMRMDVTRIETALNRRMPALMDEIAKL